jgi:hypothetical protein
MPVDQCSANDFPNIDACIVGMDEGPYTKAMLMQYELFKANHGHSVEPDFYLVHPLDYQLLYMELVKTKFVYIQGQWKMKIDGYTMGIPVIESTNIKQHESCFVIK